MRCSSRSTLHSSSSNWQCFWEAFTFEINVCHFLCTTTPNRWRTIISSLDSLRYEEAPMRRIMIMAARVLFLTNLLIATDSQIHIGKPSTSAFRPIHVLKLWRPISTRGQRLTPLRRQQLRDTYQTDPCRLRRLGAGYYHCHRILKSLTLALVACPLSSRLRQWPRDGVVIAK